jgi:pilus assembly protein CpaF
MLQAMNTGVEGSMTTVHANNPRDAFSRLESMILMADIAIPTRVILQQLSSAIKLVVQVSRLQDGTRKIMNVSEVRGVENDRIVVEDIFSFEREGVNELRRVQGRFVCNCNQPRIFDRFRMMGIELDSGVFEESLSIS